MRLTLQQRYDFQGELDGSLAGAQAWDQLRSSSGPFRMARDATDLQAMLAERPDLSERAELIAWVAGDLGAQTVASYGVGSALMEARLAELVPHLVVTDFAPETVETLRRLLPQATVEQHDLLRGRPVDAELYVMHRIDTEFRRRQWRRILRAHRRAPIVFVAGGEFPDDVMKDRLRHWREWRERGVKAGYIRTRDSIEALWARSHRSERREDLGGWLLTPRASQIK